MEKNRVLGELLYIGLRYEKSRPWKRKFNKEQTEHIVLLREILMAMMEDVYILILDNVMERGKDGIR